MLSAKTKNQQIIQLIQLQSTQIEQLKKQAYSCPICNEPVFIKNGKIKQPHFAHKKQSQCSVARQGETEEHRTLKRVFARWCEQDRLAYKVEHYLPSLRQIPDILIDHLVIELQCSSLSVQRLVERTETYHKAGYFPVWLCGNTLAHTKHSLSYLGKNFCSYSHEKGFYIWQVDLKKQELRLYYHLEENHQGQLYFTCQCWPFFQNRLLDILNTPHIQEKPTNRKHAVGQLMREYYYDLMKKSQKRNSQIRLIQSTLYQDGLHLLQLPIWFYYPGIRLFYCQKSEILLKAAIWNWLQTVNQAVIHYQDLQQELYTIFLKVRPFFYDFPLISKTDLFSYYFQQLFSSLIQCQHLCQKSDNTWLVNVQSNSETQASIQKALQQFEKKNLISAIPMKSMIR